MNLRNLNYLIENDMYKLTSPKQNYVSPSIQVLELGTNNPILEGSPNGNSPFFEEFEV